MIKYTLTNESATVVINGDTKTVRKTAPNYLALRKAIIEEDEKAILANLTVAKSLKDWAKGKFTVSDNLIAFDGVPLPTDLNDRIIQMATNNEDPSCMFLFWERLQKNPSYRSVQQLWKFLRHSGISFAPDGCFYAYKGVNSDYTDCHSGRFENKPGVTLEMPRNQISDDPNHACHEGFHVGALDHAKGYGQRIIICKVAPEDVVCVPYDSSSQKMRVSKYYIEGNYGSTLPSTTYVPEERIPSQMRFPDDDESGEDLDEGSSIDDEIDQSFDEEEKVVDVDTPVLKTAGNLIVPKRFKKIHLMAMEDLLKKSIDDLRHYATYGLKIIGASKIPGGKVALVARICEVRGAGSSRKGL